MTHPEHSAVTMSVEANLPAQKKSQAYTTAIFHNSCICKLFLTS